MTEPDHLSAALLQLAEQSQKLTDLDQREASNASELGARITAMAATLSRLKDVAADQSQALDGLAGLADHMHDLAARIDATVGEENGDLAGTGYKPVPAPAWWKLSGPDRDRALTRLRAWVDEVYRPGHGHHATGLGDCWDQHPLCLYILDWLSELWSVLYLQPERTPGALAGQAEWHTRLLPAAQAILSAETRRCHHAARPGTPAATAIPGTSLPAGSR